MAGVCPQRGFECTGALPWQVQSFPQGSVVWTESGVGIWRTDLKADLVTTPCDLGQGPPSRSPRKPCVGSGQPPLTEAGHFTLEVQLAEGSMDPGPAIRPDGSPPLACSDPYARLGWLSGGSWGDLATWDRRASAAPSSEEPNVGYTLGPSGGLLGGGAKPLEVPRPWRRGGAGADRAPGVLPASPARVSPICEMGHAGQPHAQNRGGPCPETRGSRVDVPEPRPLDPPLQQVEPAPDRKSVV